jgi:hypothetical protein
MEYHNPPTIQEHEEVRRKYVSLAWQLWQSQQKVQFYVWHPIPEEHLKIEVQLFWRGQIQHIHGWTDIIGQITAPIVDAIKGVFTWFWDNVVAPGINLALAGLGWIADQAYSLIKPALDALWDWLKGVFSTIAETLKQIGMWIVNGIKTYVVDPFIALIKPVFDAISNIVMGLWNFITSAVGSFFGGEYRGSVNRWLGIISGAAVMSISGYIGAALIDLVHPLKRTEAGEIAKFAIQWSGVAYLQHAFYTTYFDIACATPVKQELNAMFQNSIPGMADLIRFMVREVFREDIVRLYRMDEDYPPEIEQHAARHGYSARWCKAYWRAHWELPSVTQGYEMFHREVIDRPTLETLMRTLDIMPFWRDKLIQISYELIPRVDLRRAWEAGVISDEELERRMRWIGYSPEDARIELLTQKRVALAAEINDLEKLVERRFRKGFITIEQARKELEALGFHPLRIDMRIQYYQLLTETEWKESYLDILDDYYSKDLLTDEELKSQAQNIIVRGEVLDLYLDRAWLKKYKKPKTAISIKLAE